MNVKFTLRGVVLNRDELDVLTRKAEFSLDRFGDKLTSVEVVLEDINGPRGGEDKVCRLILRLLREPTVILEERGTTSVGVGVAAMERAARCISERKARRISRRTATPRITAG